MPGPARARSVRCPWVEILLSTDAHMRSKLGRYKCNARTLAQLGIEPIGASGA